MKRTIAILLINSFLLLDAVWAGGEQMATPKTADCLSPSIQIDDQALLDSFQSLEERMVTYHWKFIPSEDMIHARKQRLEEEAQKRLEQRVSQPDPVNHSNQKQPIFSDAREMFMGIGLALMAQAIVLLPIATKFLDKMPGVRDGYIAVSFVAAMLGAVMYFIGLLPLDRIGQSLKSWIEKQIALRKMRNLLNAQDVSRKDLHADVLLLCGNDNIETFKEVLRLYKEKKIGKILLTGGYGRLTYSLLIAAQKAGFEVKINDGYPFTVKPGDDLTKLMVPWLSEPVNLEALNNQKNRAEYRKIVSYSESQIINQIMHLLAMQMRITLKDDIECELDSRHTLENFQYALPYLEEFKQTLHKDRLIVAYMQTPHQQLRTKATFNQSKLKQEWQRLGVTGISYTIDWDISNLSQDAIIEQIASEMWRVAIYTAKEDLVPFSGKREGLDTIADNYWQKTLRLMALHSDQTKLKDMLYSLALDVDSFDFEKEVNLRKQLANVGKKNISTSLDELIKWVYADYEFHRVIEDIASREGISLESNPKIALFIGGPHIQGGYYYRLFDDIVRKQLGINIVYLPVAMDKGKRISNKQRAFIKKEMKENRSIIGAVITRPWKEDFLDILDEDATNGCKAVNYIVVNSNTKKVRGSAIDGKAWVDGLNRDLGKEYDFKGKKIVILGAGGAAKEIALELSNKGLAKITFADTAEKQWKQLKDIMYGEAGKDKKIDYDAEFVLSDDPANNAQSEELHKVLKESDIVINATGIGRKDTLGNSSLVGHEELKGKIVSDLISDTETQILTEARRNGAKAAFYGRSMFIFGMVKFMQGWIEQVPGGRVPTDTELYNRIDEWLVAYEKKTISADTFGENENLVGDIRPIESLIQEYIPERLRGLFQAPQRGPFHQEGPVLTYHLQNMLNVLNTIDDFKDILPGRYITLIKDNRDFFVWYILLHDIGKSEMAKENEDGSISYWGHDEKSADIVREYGLASGLPKRDSLMNIIRLHMGIFDKNGIREQIKANFPAYFKENDIDTDDFDLLICASFLDMAWRHEKNRNFQKDMERVKMICREWENFRRGPSMATIWQDLLNMEGSRIQELKGQSTLKDALTQKTQDKFEHTEMLARFEQGLDENRNNRTEARNIVVSRKDPAVAGLDEKRIDQFLDYYYCIPQNELKLLRYAIALHDLGNIYGKGEFPEGGRELSLPVLKGLVSQGKITEQESKVILALIFLHTNFNTLHFGEVLPDGISQYLEKESVDKELYFRLAPILYIADVGSVATGRLADGHLSNALFMSKQENISALIDNWSKVRLVLGFCGKENIVIDFSRMAMLMVPDHAAKTLKYIRANGKADDQAFWNMLKTTSFRGHAVYIMRFLNEFSQAGGDAENALVKFLYILSRLQAEGADFDDVWFTPPTNDKEFAAKLVTVLSRVSIGQLQSIVSGSELMEKIKETTGISLIKDGNTLKVDTEHIDTTDVLPAGRVDFSRNTLELIGTAI
ncbi:MAG: HD domain-containing protein [Candidatus Omnitrophica bacterium]|nr:HD domain-containing protein [Candidatus Omnitrophota bacterium]